MVRLGTMVLWFVIAWLVVLNRPPEIALVRCAAWSENEIAAPGRGRAFVSSSPPPIFSPVSDGTPHLTRDHDRYRSCFTNNLKNAVVMAQI